MLEIDRLAKRFGTAGLPADTPLFDHVSLSLQPGECVAIVGESGVGKSTLLNCIAGLEPFDAGEVRIDGEALSQLDDDALAHLRRRKLGFVFQAFHILPHLDVGQNVALPLWLLDVSAGAADARACAMLASVGLAGRERDGPAKLSGGELQRVAIARALVHGPSLVLADEPTGNLDPERAAEVLNVLRDSIRAAQAVGIIVTHSPLAARSADRILRLRRDGLHEEAADAWCGGC